MPPLDGVRVLLVEDEAHVAFLLEDLLTDLGCEVAASVARLGPALRRAEEGGFDVALLDINLAGEQSFPVAEALARRGVPFLFATGYGAAGVPEALSGAPVLAKPFRQADIRDALLSLLRR
ncbi:MAG: response regulator [Caulobacteraceae bacterium]